MNADDEILLTTILRRMLVANDDAAILADVRGLQRKIKGLGVNPHTVGINGSTAEIGRYDILRNALDDRNQAQTLFQLWEKASQAMLKDLADSRGGHPPDGYVFRYDVDRMETPTEVAERHTKRMLWEIKQIIRRNADLHKEKAKLEDRVAYLEAALATGMETA